MDINVILNEKQVDALNMVKEGKNVFITGSAGVGKSLVIEYIKEWCMSNGKHVMVTATTGVAAANINGATFHSWAGIGLGKSAKQNMSEPEMEQEIRKRAYYINKKDESRSRYVDTDILIIDEVSMLDFEFVGKVNKIAKLLRKNSSPFGGIQLVITGDFFQLGPIQKDRKKVKFLFEDYIWQDIVDECVHLTEVYRQNSSEFIDMLHKIRVGDISDEITKKLQTTTTNTLHNELGIIPTVLFCKNADVNAINIRGVQKLEGEENKFKSVDFYRTDAMKELYNNSFTYQYEIALKVGAQVMLIKNLDIKTKLVNGSRGVVVEILEDDPVECPGGAIKVRFVDGRERVIKPDTQEVKEEQNQDKKGSYKEPIVLASRCQFPLKLAYALTVHKSQGLSIDYLHVDLKGAFSPGQAYVALSRATSFDTLKVTNFTSKCVITSEQVKNFYKMIDNGQFKKRKRDNGQSIDTYFKKQKNDNNNNN
jgi:ATP-dependent DNA helicase PIF1